MPQLLQQQQLITFAVRKSPRISRHSEDKPQIKTPLRSSVRKVNNDKLEDKLDSLNLTNVNSPTLKLKFSLKNGVLVSQLADSPRSARKSVRNTPKKSDKTSTTSAKKSQSESVSDSTVKISNKVKKDLFKDVIPSKHEKINSPASTPTRSSGRQLNFHKESSDESNSSLYSPLKKSTKKTVAKKSPLKRKSPSKKSEADDENLNASPKKIKKFIQKVQLPELNIYQKFKHALSTTNSDKLVFRDKESKAVEELLSSHLESEKSTSLYVSGPPGTGKTATIKSVLTKLEDIYQFRVISLNGMSFTTPTAFYQKVLNELGQKNALKKDLQANIENELCNRKKMIVLMLDEIDILDTKHQEMLYTIFEWPRIVGSKVIIVGIANTLDFTSKTLIRFHSLRLEPMKEIAFYPYDKEQISGIIKNRLESIRLCDGNIIMDAAIELCARKVSSYSGDARKALDIMRRSVELVEQEIFEKEKCPLKSLPDGNISPNSKADTYAVQVSHVIKILNQVFGNKIVQVQEDDYNFPLQQQLILCVALVLMKNSKKEIEIGKCYDTFVKICNQKGLSFDISNASDFVSMCYLLEAKGFISLKTSKDIRSMKFTLSIDEEEIKDMLKDKALFKSILNSF